jgi:nucleoid DNA-binding protein
LFISTFNSACSELFFVEHPNGFESITESSTRVLYMAKAAGKAEKPLTKVQIFSNIAETTGLSKKQVAEVFEALKVEISNAIGKKGVGTFVVPDLAKIVRVQKKALPKRQVRNPQTGEMKWADPKPASTSVKVRPLKKLKDMV